MQMPAAFDRACANAMCVTVLRDMAPGSVPCTLSSFTNQAEGIAVRSAVLFMHGFIFIMMLRRIVRTRGANGFDFEVGCCIVLERGFAIHVRCAFGRAVSRVLGVLCTRCWCVLGCVGTRYL